MDNIIVEMIWLDSNPVDDIFRVEITASNDRITMSTKVFVQPPDMIEFEKGAGAILLEPFTVRIGDDNTRGCVSFTFTPNHRGIVDVSVFMRSMGHCEKNDTANFTIQTDIASLDRFAAALKSISKGGIGTKVQLHDV